ncbi:hypothetical protein NHH03_19860 [Stieleria sp. TO1_6]|uniref:LamG-like jellyroll fold domain-containing protein n=1 Tax=Stieleria tagensis TaxID=2956795 RepID=UPI00209A9698|nr:LamG-like jellyroll fold domain-containing protein [Stieleria tagensis]MCO8124010.1 hypothetical protein [Stieleria tagensis]
MIQSRLPSAFSTLALFVLIAAGSIAGSASADSPDAFQVGAAVVDVSPTQLPVIVNGSFLSHTADKIKTRVNARALVMRQGDSEIGMVVVDSCMIPKEIIDDVKHRVAAQTKLRADQIMISATHTHTAPSAFGALGTDPDLSYIPLLRERIIESLVTAEANLQPAKFGWGTAEAAGFTALRRWVLRTDRAGEDPFGNRTVRANMHAATKMADVTGPSGPEDPTLSMLAFQSLDGDPIAVLANFSMHYFGDQPISADYFGLFCDGMEKHIAAKANAAADASKPRPVGLLSHGCSGDIWRRDYVTWTGSDDTTIEGYTQALLAIATEAYDSIEYSSDADLAMAERRLKLDYRVPDKQRLQWGQQITDGLNGELPTSRVEVYAREQVLLDEMQSTEVVVQAIRIGDVAIATVPTETYALTGLKIKSHSPLEKTMVIELANGADGYIPPPEQHVLGGYNTWAARSAGLEVQAEPKITANAISLLEQVADQPRRRPRQSIGPAAQALLDLQPIAYWRLDEMEGPTAADVSGHQHMAMYEPGVVFYLPGSTQQSFTEDGQVNRCAHFAGGRMQTRLESIGENYTIILSFWNGVPNDARSTTGWLVSCDHPHWITGHGDHLGIGGTETTPGYLVFQHGTDQQLIGKTPIERWSWNRLMLVRSGDQVDVYLNDSTTPEISGQVGARADLENLFIGGRCDNESNFEGRIDEVAVFDKSLGPDAL